MGSAPDAVPSIAESGMKRRTIGAGEDSDVNFDPFPDCNTIMEKKTNNSLGSKALICLFLALSQPSFVDSQTRDDASVYSKVGEAILERINGSKIASTIGFSPDYKRRIEEYGLDNLFDYYHKKFGLINYIGLPEIKPGFAKFQISAERGRWSMIVGFDNERLIHSLQFIDPDPIIAVPKRNTTPMRLPFRGEWTVEAGGPTANQNYHSGAGGHPSIRRAVDFTIRDAEGLAYKGNGTKNEDYYAFGKEILAAADGEVVAVIDGVPDNRPFSDNPMSVAGNVAIIKHANNEYSRYFHFKINSICVKVGQKVLSGQVIGQCGNSGSPGPHLHFDLTNTDVAADATGFPPYFERVILRKNGVTTTPPDYTPALDDNVQARD
jgi:Peptidase family M23